MFSLIPKVSRSNTVYYFPSINDLVFFFFFQTFLFFLPINLGADIIICAGLLNKASGIYGLLSLLTGHPISVMSWILHITSVVSLPLYIHAYISAKNRNALYMLLFAYIYLLDTGIDIGFTIVFCVKWFAEARRVSKVLSAATSAAADISASGSTTSSVISSIASATSTAIAEATTAAIKNIPTSPADAPFSIATAAPEPVFLKRAAAVAVEAASGAEAAAIAAANSAAAVSASNQSTSVARESVVTIILTVFLLLVRIYFTFVIIGFARKLVREENLRKYNGTPKNSWRAKAQRILLTPFESFWTGFSSRSSNYSPLMTGTRSKLGNGRRHQAAVSSIASDAGLLANPYDDDDDDDRTFAIKSKNEPNNSPSLNDIDLESLGDIPISPTS